jgi:predicted transcriptional regulator
MLQLKIIKGKCMPLRRSKLDIMLNVLSAVREGIEKPTRIMYSANLSWRPTQKVLGSLVEQGLLYEIDDSKSKRSKKKYGITEKGLNVIEYFEGAKNLIEIENE